jgi:hypothetical protein
MKYKVGQRVKIRQDHFLPDWIISGSMDPRFYDWMTSNIMTIRNATEHKKYGVIYEFELPEGITSWVREEAVRALKNKPKPAKQLGEIEQLDKIALNFREG